MAKTVPQAVRDALLCFANQPKTGGVTPPDIGPRSRQWWKDNTPEEYDTYFDYFMSRATWLYFRDEPPPFCYQPPNLPTAETVGVTPFNSSTVELHGKVIDDGGEKCGVRFQYGETTDYDHYTLWYEGKETNDIFEEFISNLEGTKTYHYRAQIRNSNGVSGGEDKTFTTTPEITVPVGHTNDAVDISMTTAILKGFLSDPGGEPCEYRFQWGETDAYGNDTAWRPGAWTFSIVSQLITGLEIFTNYHFRVQFKNSAGTFSGEDYTFKTTHYITLYDDYIYQKQGKHLNYSTAWANCRNAEVGDYLWPITSPALDIHWYGYLNKWAIGKDRVFISFDTEGLTPKKATLKFHIGAKTNQRLEAEMRVYVFKKAENFATTDWGAGTLIKTYKYSTTPANAWYEIEVASEYLNSEGKTCFRFVMRKDEDNLQEGEPAKDPMDYQNGMEVGQTIDDFPPELTVVYCDLPTCSTDKATDIYGDRATLKGYLDDSGGEECEYRFQYGKTAALGEVTIWRAGIISYETFKEKIEDLDPETVYYYRAQAKNSAGTFNGKIESFSTVEATQSPVCTTKEAEAVGYTTAELRGYLENDGGEECEYRFEYGKNLPYKKTTGWKGSIRSFEHFLLKLWRLDVDTGYHYRVQVKNSSGISSGEDITFKTFPTWGKPLCETLPAIEIEHDNARIRGIVNDDLGQECEYRFQWGKTTDYGSKAAWKKPVHTGEKYSRGIQKLDADTLYHFRAEVKNVMGTNIGKDLTFNTLSAGGEPEVLTVGSEDHNDYSVTLKGFIQNDGKEKCQYRFVWGYGAEYTFETPWWVDKELGENFNCLIWDITPNIDCHFRAEIRNRLGTAYGEDKTFNLSSVGTLPGCSTCNPSNVTKITAIINGRLIWDQGEDCEVRFCYGQNRDCTKSTPWEGPYREKTTISKKIISLAPFRSIYYRVEVKNSHGTSKGKVFDFTTGLQQFFSEVIYRYE